MKKTILSLAVVAVLTGCATGSAIREKMTGKQFDEPVVENNVYLTKDENKLAPPAGGPVPIAVYSFRDLTGQRKSVPNIASLSSAVTQGADSYLIKALQDVGDQRWFIVLERVGLENLIKERQMIRQMREQYQGKDAKPLPPMIFAGVIIEGGIVGYDSNTQTGGSGIRLLGIGATTQYQSDTVTVTLRTVSVSTGEVLTTTTVTKTVLSYMDKFGVLKFVSEGEKAIEAEVGASLNESINKATNLAIQAAVVNTIKEGARKGHWSFKEERKNELVQSQAPAQRAPEVTPAPQQPSKPESVGESKVVEPNADTKQEVKIEPKAEVKVEPKVEEAKAEKKPVENKIVEVRPLFGQRKLKEAEYIYKEPDEKSQKTWQFKKGTIINVIQPGSEGWLRITDSESRGGWVRTERLEEVK